ncbi:ketol-acid reductoisomerase [Woodsholea maritima]|uniref:ketol-acid reductoisomerase n=1 Tax=Woodsholea maritima TaxID=240237 RepID=UPI000361AE0F|nr:ketol-acid reductoisomerase [Woodsholea maritima]
MSMPPSSNSTTDAPLYEAEIDLAPIKARRLVIVGYGNHGRAHALNLRDYGVEAIVIALREGSPRYATAREDGFDVMDMDRAAQWGDAFSILAADEAHGQIWRDHLAPHHRAGKAYMFCHGFSIEYGLIDPPPDADILLCSPKGPGGAVRATYLKGGGLIGFYGVHQDASGTGKALALAYMAGVGCGRAGIYPSTFREEALSDILGEQAVLVGGLVALARQGFETLVKAGVSPRMAYIDSVHEIKYLADLIHTRGVHGMYGAISDTAEFGAHRVEDKIATALAPVFEEISRDVISGRFAQDWVADFEKDRESLYRARAAWKDHPLDAAGAQMRAMITKWEG